MTAGLTISAVIDRRYSFANDRADPVRELIDVGHEFAAQIGEGICDEASTSITLSKARFIR